MYDSEGYQPNTEPLPFPADGDSSCDNDKTQPHCSRMTFDAR